jgi:hypothetical protein
MKQLADMLTGYLGSHIPVETKLLRQALNTPEENQPQPMPPNPDQLAQQLIDSVTFADNGPVAYITEADTVFCAQCWEDREQDIGDRDPNGWLSTTMNWQPSNECSSCGSTNGHFNEPPHDSGDETQQSVWDGPEPFRVTH